MSVRRTVEADIVIGGDGWALDLTNVLGASVAGSATVTNEAFLGTRDEEASVHAVSYSVELSTLYDNADVDALRARVGQAANIYIGSNGLFCCFPLDVPEIPRTAGAVEPITASFTMGASGQGRYGTGITSFDLAQNKSSQGGIDLSGAEAVHVVVSEISSTAPAAFRLVEGSDNVSIPAKLGIHRVAIPAAMRASGASISITSASNRSVKGFVLVGSDVPVAADAV